MQTEKSQPEGKRKMPKTRLTKFPALSIDPRTGISRFASETDVELFLLPIFEKNVVFIIIFSTISFFSLSCLSPWARQNFPSSLKVRKTVS